MSDYIDLPNMKDFVSIKEAAEMLGLSYKTVYEYVSEGRIPGVWAADVIMLPVEEVKKFKPNISGRPRKSFPVWRISPKDNTLLITSVTLKIKPGQDDAFTQKLEEIKSRGEHMFPGTVARYFTRSEVFPERVSILLIWRSSVMPDETVREQALEALRQELADVLDWSTAEYDMSKILMHT